MRARSMEMAMSPASPFALAGGNDSTSVAWSFPRKNRLRRRTSASFAIKQVMVRPRATRRVISPKKSRSPSRSTCRERWDEEWKSSGMSSGDMRAASGRCFRNRHRLWGGLDGRRFREFERQLTVDTDDLVVAFVSLDDFLHQIVAHHVAVVELNEADAF